MKKTEEIKPYPLFSCEDMMKWPPTRWLIKDILPEGGCGVLYGKPGDGKSFLALSWAMSVARGVPWLDKFDTISGSVLYIYAEGVSNLPKRIKAYFKHNECEKPENLSFLAEAVNFSIEAECQRLFATLKPDPTTIKLVIIDTMSRCLAGVDDSSVKEISILVERIDQIRKLTKAFVLVVHHPSKNNDIERGSGSLRGAMDVMINIKKNKNTGEIALKCTKQKDGEEFDPIPLRLKQISLEDNESSVVIVSSEFQMNAYTALSKNGRSVLQVLESFDNEGATSKEWLEASQISDASYYRAIDELKDKELITQEEPSGKGSKYTITQKGRDIITI